jgi:hypothetical protein
MFARIVDIELVDKLSMHKWKRNTWYSKTTATVAYMHADYCRLSIIHEFLKSKDYFITVNALDFSRYCSILFSTIRVRSPLW